MKFHLFSLVLIVFLIRGSHERADGPIITPVTNPVEFTEEPTWDVRRNILYYVDMLNGSIYAYHYNTKEVTRIQLVGPVTPVIPSKNDPNLFYVGLGRSLVALEWDGFNNTPSKQKVLTTVSDDFPDSRFNDGKADKRGRLWWGTIGFEKDAVVIPYHAHFYEFTSDNLRNPKIVRHEVTNSNGLAWNKANDKLYYIDTPTLKVVEFDYYDENGTISDYNRTAFDLTKHHINGLPDGMTIDVNDNLWIALFNGSSIINVNPRTGELIQQIPLPAQDVSSAMWGGPNLDILYVTTSRLRLNEEQRKQFPFAGSVFAIQNLNTRGLPVFGGDLKISL